MDILNNLNGKYIYGLTLELRAMFLYKKFEQAKRPLICVTSSIYDANRLYQSLLNYTSKVYFFPMDDFLTSEALAMSPDLKFTRLQTLCEIQKEDTIVVTNLMGFLRFLPNPQQFNESFINIKINEEYNIEKLSKKLSKMGYKKTSIVSKTGEFATRGFIVDLFPINIKNPIRLEFFGDEIDRISEFDINTQISRSKINSLEIKPVTEFLIDEDVDIDKPQREIIKYMTPASLMDYLENPLLVFNDKETIDINYKLLSDEITEYKKLNDIFDKQCFMHELKTTYLDDEMFFMEFDNKKHKDLCINYSSFELENFIGGIEIIKGKFNSYIKEGKTIVICMSDKYKLKKLYDNLNMDEILFSKYDEIINNKINLVVKKINKGFIINDLVVISEKEIYNKKENLVAYKSNFKIGSKVRDITKLNVGDYVVHLIYGIGIYKGITVLTKNGLKKDYLAIEYKNNDKLYVPVEKLEFINKYSSYDNIALKINKLGSSDWKKTKLSIKKRIESIASDLLKLYSERELTIGFAFPPDEKEQILFEQEFEYEETSDQLKVTEEIKKDMERKVPMDRLLCGDVGYGKTEVAFRAVFKAVLANKQVLMLCPTTILSQQHYQNALERFKSYPIRIELLNRFINNKSQKQIIKDYSEGKIDLLIGTHRVLSDDVISKRLGLLVIDEEQRFGVKHKEKIKNYKKNIDVLTLSATPIPRTLQMSLAGIRSLSLIETPPTDRYPIQTYVLEENDSVIKDAIYKELSRNGQVFILYNSIDRMKEKMSQLAKLVPEARIVCGHGKMQKQELEEIMYKFINNEYDVLLCTTIIETGIDIPNANTLIIIDADKYGLSQLYQIRGRVGRSNKIAYAYLMYNRGKVLNEISKKRLNAIKEFTELGSGFSIAMRDLSIRGAGDILGEEQSGFIDAIGIELFLNMLNDEVNRLKGIELKEKETPLVPLIEVETSIDDNYVKEEDVKIEIHRLINKINTHNELLQTKIELEDRFGALNDKMIIYMYEELFEKEVNKLNIKKVMQTKKIVSITLPQKLTSDLDGENLFLEILNLNHKFRFNMKNKELTIILDIINLKKHFIYYLIDMIEIIKKSIK